ncbi:MAG: ATP-binding cassette domain-containing protein [Spiribacter sp.]|nr:ATP-binding cassette domain-containing protein [Spiribacter sp.]MDR9480482.1 ATP-binding cassette domain-containing protein [Spiribacter sp.]
MSLELHALDITAPTGEVLINRLSLTIQAGEIVTLMGPSGAGKSTLLNAIAGHLPHGFRLDGDITLNGQSLLQQRPEARRIGLMFQDAMLFPHLSVGDNLAFGLQPGVKGRQARRAAVERALSQAGLPGLYDRHPDRLSGGQRSRVALMRTLLAKPAGLLLDEPFASLDANRRAEIRAFTLAHIRQRAIPVLLVTHDPEDAAAINGRVEAL